MVGNYWHYRFSALGKTFRGSTNCTSRSEALTFVQALRASKLVGWGTGPLDRRFFNWARSLESTLPSLKVPAAHGSGPDSINLSGGIPVVCRHRVHRTWKEPTLTTGNLKAFLDALDSLKEIPAQVVLAIRTMLFMGLRAHEVREMRWEHFDQALVTYTVCTSMSQQLHQVPVPTDLSHRFREWKESSHASWSAQGKPTPGLVFWKPDGREHSLICLINWIRAAATSIGIPLPSSSHWLRKSFATLLLESGVSPFLIHRLMRVSDHTWGTPHGVDDRSMTKTLRQLIDSLAVFR